MATITINKLSSGNVSFKRDTEPMRIINGFDQLAVSGTSVLLYENGNNEIIHAEDTLVINSVTFTGTAEERAVKLGTDVFSATNSGSGGSGVASLDDVPDSTTRFAMTAAQKDYLNALMGVNNP